MKTQLLLASLLAVTALAPAETGLISVADAKKLIETSNPIVLDTRGGYKDYFRGHLPTAHHLNFDTLRGTEAAVPVQYLPDDLSRVLLLRAGVNQDRTHLIYATGAKLPNDEILSATMVAYVLDKFGVKDVKIVDGGLAAWTSAGFEVARDYYGNAPGTLPAEGNPSIGVDAKTAQAHPGKPGAVLVDARPLNEYRGEDDVWLRKGHIPGAISFHWARLVEADNTHKFKDAEGNKALLAKAGLTPDKDIICYCGTSREGSLLYFYLKHVLGYPKVRLYEGSWKEYVWLEQKSLPVETGGTAAGE